MEEKQSKADLLALRGGLRGRFRRVFDGMENAFEVLPPCCTAPVCRAPSTC